MVLCHVYHHIYAATIIIAKCSVSAILLSIVSCACMHYLWYGDLLTTLHGIGGGEGIVKKGPWYVMKKPAVGEIAQRWRVATAGPSSMGNGYQYILLFLCPSHQCFHSNTEEKDWDGCKGSDTSIAYMTPLCVRNLIMIILRAMEVFGGKMNC